MILLMILGSVLTVLLVLRVALYAYTIRKAREQGEEIELNWKLW